MDTGDDVTQYGEEEDEEVSAQEDDDGEDDSSVDEDEEEEEEDEDHPAEVSSDEFVCRIGEMKPAEEEAAGLSGSSRKRMRAEKDGAVWEYEADCPVCMEPWTEEGQHQSCSLKCGHTFGRSCIEKWIRDWKKNKCPKCKKHSKISDIRPIYPKRIAVVEKILLKDLDIIRAEKRLIEEKVKDQEAMIETAHLEVERMYNKTEKCVSFARERMDKVKRRMDAIEEHLNNNASK